MTFPDHFAWGATTSSYQIEGGWDEDGKGLSIWDMYTRQKGRIWENNTGDIACDHYHRVQEDVALMSKIALQAYRFSVSWARIIPDGNGAINQKGLDFYDRLVDELLAKKIEPWVTLFHWDFPYALFLRGGWLNPDSPQWFAKYATAVTKRLSDRVSHWITINEPQCYIGMGYATGEHAPGLRLDIREVLIAVHHCLLAHGRAVMAIRENAVTKPVVGWSPAGMVYHPVSNAPADVKAARKVTLAVYADNLWNNSWWGDPVVFGHYPEEGLRVYGSSVPKYSEADFKVIRQPIDFYGCNIFKSEPIEAGPDGNPRLAALPPGHAHTHYLWNLTPEALYWGPRFLSEHYKLPIVVTENGMSELDMVAHDGKVHDGNRIEFMSRYLLQLRHAIEEGIDVRGYFCWSLMDNFEWNEGYKHRFGLIHIDFETQQRTLKDSALWYRDVITSNGGVLDNYLSISADGGPQLPFVIKESIRFIDENVHRQFNVKELAAHIRCHPDFLSRKFKQVTGLDLSVYIRRCRIDHAKELLKDPDASIDDVAEKSGFADRIHFTKVFGKLSGQTPGQFQRQHRMLEERGAASPAVKAKNPRSTRAS